MAGFDATLGGATATSYISIAEADAFLANTQYTGTWQGNTEAEKSKYLNAATFGWTRWIMRALVAAPAQTMLRYPKRLSGHDPELLATESKQRAHSSPTR